MCPFEWVRKKIHKEYFEMRRNLIITILASSLIGLVAWSQFSGVPESVESIDLAESAYERLEIPDFPADGRLYAEEFIPVTGMNDSVEVADEIIAAAELGEGAGSLEFPEGGGLYAEEFLIAAAELGEGAGSLEFPTGGDLYAEEFVIAAELSEVADEIMAEAQFVNLPPLVDSFAELFSEESVISIESLDEAQFVNLPPLVDWYGFASEVGSTELVTQVEVQSINLPPLVDSFAELYSEEQNVSAESLVEAQFNYLVPLVEGYLDIMDEAQFTYLVPMVEGYLDMMSMSEDSSWIPDYPADGKLFVDYFIFK
jgi:hypothetical protein